MTKKTPQQRAVEAENAASRWLGNANEAREAGNFEKAARCEAKAQKFLDAANRARGNGDGSDE